MYDSRLFSLLKSLEKEEIHWFRKFLNSSFYNANQKITRLAEYILKYYPKLDSPKLQKKVTFRKLFPGRKYDPQVLRKLMHSLAELVEQFMVAMHLRKDKFGFEKVLVQNLGQRDAFELFEKKTGKLLDQLEAQPYRDTRYFLEGFQLNYNLYAHPGTEKGSPEVNTMEKADEMLDFHFLIQKEIINCSIMSKEFRVQKKSRRLPLEERSVLFQKNVTYDLYCRIRNIFQNPNNQSLFDETLKILKNAIGNISNSELENMLKSLLSVMSISFNKGNTNLAENIFRLYQLGVQEKILFSNNMLTDRTFTNVISIGVICGHMNWVLNFIHNYKKYIPTETREDAYNYGLVFFLSSKSNA